MNTSHIDQTLWLVYITIKNPKAKTWQSQKRLRTLLLSSFSIIYVQSKYVNHKDKNLKSMIY